MTVYPKYTFRLPFLGEERVFRLLQALDDDRGFAVHSMNLPEHEYKRWGEADFVIVSLSGVTLLEVKGGTVSFVDRVWRYANARGQAIESTEGPARQALSAVRSLEALLAKALGRRVPCRWGVAFPLCVFHQALVELPADRLADHETCRSVETFRRWLDEVPFPPDSRASHRLTSEEVEQVRSTLVPEFHAAESLGLAVSAGRQRAILLTDQQSAFLEGLKDNPRLLVIGGAGTGKTELAVATTRVEETGGHRPVLVVPGRYMADLMRARVGGELDVRSDVPVHVPGTLIVDEGQDFMSAERMGRVFAAVDGGIAAGRWRWFMDPNLQFVQEPVEQACVEKLRRHAVCVTLTRNVRTTREVVGCVGAILQADLGLSSIHGFGRKVRLQRTAREVEDVVRLIASLVEDDVSPADIAILGPQGAQGPVCAEVLERFPSVLGCMEDLVGQPDRGRGVVASMDDFRGMESPIVVLADLDRLPPGEVGRSLLYIGMTRAVSALWIMMTKSTSDLLKSYLMRN